MNSNRRLRVGDRVIYRGKGKLRTPEYIGKTGVLTFVRPRTAVCLFDGEKRGKGIMLYNVELYTPYTEGEWV